MRRKISIFIMMFLLLQQVTLFARDVSVGGHAKMTLLDYLSGDHNGTSDDQYIGFGFQEFILYITAELSDKISMDLQPYVDVTTGATPVPGRDIGTQRRNARNAKPQFQGFRKAAMTLFLPLDFELSFGIVKPRFTWDYGAERFWEEEYIGSKFSNNDFLGSMHDTGFELYRNFEIGNISMPTYLYALNGGSEYADNNRAPMGMVRIEPEAGALKLAGSFACGRYDDDHSLAVTRYALGLAYTISDFDIRAEYAGGTWEAGKNAAEDAESSGYYAKLLYRLSSGIRAMMHFNTVDHNFNGFTHIADGQGEEYVTWTPGLQIFLSDAAILQVQADMADWKTKDGSSALNFTRIVAGVRATF